MLFVGCCMRLFLLLWLGCRCYVSYRVGLLSRVDRRLRFVVCCLLLVVCSCFVCWLQVVVCRSFVVA